MSCFDHWNEIDDGIVAPIKILFHREKWKIAATAFYWSRYCIGKENGRKVSSGMN